MLVPQLLISLFYKESLTRLFFWCMGIGIVILIDSLGTIYLATLLGAYFAVALTGIITWVNLAIVFSSMSRHMKLSRKMAFKGIYPRQEIRHLSGLFVAALFMILPGLISDIVGWILYITPFRLFLGHFIEKSFPKTFEQAIQQVSSEDP